MTAGPVVEWAAAKRAAAGETECGDTAVVVELPQRTLAAAIDAVGHGRPAAEAARIAEQTLREHAGEDLGSIARELDAALEGTRGAAMTLVSFGADDHAMTWFGVGNVEGRLLRGSSLIQGESETLLPHRGVAGGDLPDPRPASVAVDRGDLLVLATDGVRPSFSDALTAVGPCSEIAARALKEHALPTDDALVLAIRYLGPGRG